MSSQGCLVELMRGISANCILSFLVGGTPRALSICSTAVVANDVGQMPLEGLVAKLLA
jgi:hypothetical protein